MSECRLFALSLLLLFSVAFSCQKKESAPAAPAPVLPALSADLDAQLAQAKALADSGVVWQALERLNATLRLAADSLGEPHPRTAQLHHELGNLFNNYLQNLDSALAHFRLAAGQRQQLLTADSLLAPELAKSYFALARVLRQKGLLHPALDDIHRCLALREAARPQDSLRLGRTCYEAGVLYRESGDLENALRYLGQAVVFYQHDPAANTADLAHAWNETASTHDLLHQSETATGFFKKALEAYRSLGDLAQMAGCQTNLGGAFLRNGNFDAALPALRQALSLNGQLIAADPAHVNFRLARSAILDNLGIFYKRTGQPSAALGAARQSLELALSAYSSRFHPAVAGCFDNLGNALMATGRPKEALEAYQQGISCVVPEFKESIFFKNPPLAIATVSEKPLLLILLQDKAEALLQLATTGPKPLNCLLGAFDTFRSADTLLLQIRQSCREDGSKFFLAEEAGPMYEQALSLTFDLWERTGDTLYRNAALAFCERNKAGILLESLNDVQAKRSANAGSKTLEREQSLRQAIARQELAIFSAQQEGKTTLAQTGQDSLFLLKREKERLERQFEKEAPALFHQKFVLAQPPSPSEIQRQLPEGTAMLEYFLGDSILFTVSLTKHSIHLFRAPLPTGFWEMAGKFRRSVSNWDFVKNEPTEAEAFYLETAPALFDLLLKKQLEAFSEENIERLVIVPDGALGYLPFEAMLTEKAASWKQKKLPFLLQRYVVSYAYSAHFLAAKNKPVAGQSFVGFGLTYDDRTLQSVGEMRDLGTVPSSFSGSTRGGLGKLPYSAKEVEAITKQLNGHCWLNDTATKANFLRHAPEGGILHFAGHGFTDADHPLNSALLFSKTTDTTDCLLHAADLYGVRLNANLAVLSACNTGSGELRRGEGIMSFARAFAGAGVPAVVMSLWSVTDASTASLMQRFYHSLKVGDTKDVALRQAKLGYLETATPEHSLPIYWAGAVLMGDTSPIVNPDSFGMWEWLLFGGIFLALSVGAAWWFLRKKRGR